MKSLRLFSCALLIVNCASAAFDPLDYAPAFEVDPWVSARPEPNFAWLRGQGQSGKVSKPTAIFHDQVVTLPPYGEPIVLPLQGTYGQPEKATHAALPFADWSVVEYLSPVGFIYERAGDGLEFLLEDDSIRPVIRRPMQLEDVVTKTTTAPPPSELADYGADSLLGAIPEGLAAAIANQCPATNKTVVQSANPLCVGKDILDALLKTEQTGGGIRIMKTTGTEDSGVLNGLLGTIGSVLQLPLALLQGTGVSIWDRTIIDRPKAFGKPGEVIGVLATVAKTSEVIAMIDGTLAAVIPTTAETRLDLPVLQKLSITLDEAMEEISNTVDDSSILTPKCGSILIKPLSFLKKHVEHEMRLFDELDIHKKQIGKKGISCHALSNAIMTTIKTLKELPEHIIEAVKEMPKWDSVHPSPPKGKPAHSKLTQPKIFIETLAGTILSLIPEQFVDILKLGSLTDPLRTEGSNGGDLLDLPVVNLLNPVINTFMASVQGLTGGGAVSVGSGLAGGVVEGAANAVGDVLGLLTGLFGN